METAVREEMAPEARGCARPPRRAQRTLATLAGPSLIVVSVLVAMRGFVFANHLTNQHPDILSFWLPRSCLLGRSLAAGRVPLWNPYEMAGTPFAADPQSGWLYLPNMLLSTVLGCGDGLRALIVLNPILAGLGLFWFLRKEGLHRATATAGGLSLAMAIAGSNVGIALPFAGTLAWTPFVLVGASGYLSADRWPKRLAWLALAALAWGQVATAHLSHGLVICTGLVTSYVVARSVRDVRAGRSSARRAAGLAVLFLAFLPLANLAILVPRFALVSRSSLRGGYAALGGTLARAAGIEDRPLPTTGVWSGWPFALGTTPGAYLGAAILSAVPAALRARGRRYLVAAIGAVGVTAYLLTLTLFVGAGWFRRLVLALPFGDVYLHNPGRLRYVAMLAVPILGAVGLQGFLDRLPTIREAAWWLGAGAAFFAGLPLLLGADPLRFAVLAGGILVAVPAFAALVRGRRWAPAALAAVLAVELTGAALWSTSRAGGTVFTGLEGADRSVLAWQPLRPPRVSLDRYLEAGAIARYLQEDGEGGRYLSWVQPAAVFNKGYLFTQRPEDWPALLLGRAVLFRLRDALGYSPIQLPRYWSYIRATNRLPVFYNASVIQLPTIEDVRLLGMRFLIVPAGFEMPPGLAGDVVVVERGYELVEIHGWQPRASLVSDRTIAADGAEALETVLQPGFDPAARAVVDDGADLPPPVGTGPAGVATYSEVRPEDVRVTVEAEAPALLVVRNAWDRGWTATVDGRPAPVLRADDFLQVVPAPPARHEVRLVYTEPAIGRGLAASGLVWLGWVGVLAASLLRARRERPAGPGSPPPTRPRRARRAGEAPPR